MSHRHQSSRRRSYGRRQHELGERRGRRDEPPTRDWAIDDQRLQWGRYASGRDDGAPDAGRGAVDR